MPGVITADYFSTSLHFPGIFFCKNPLLSMTNDITRSAIDPWSCDIIFGDIINTLLMWRAVFGIHKYSNAQNHYAVRVIEQTDCYVRRSLPGKQPWLVTMTTQQTRNYFWTSWHMSYWFIIGTAPSVRVLCVFTWIHVFCLLLRVLNEFDMSHTGSELVWFQWHVSSREKLVISRETRVDTPHFFTESGEFMWIEPVELVNSLTEYVKSQVVVCWLMLIY